MATEPVPLVTVGECVSYDGKTCMVTSIENALGWNQYHLVDIDTGHSCVAARYQLTVIPFLNTLMDGETFDTAVRPTEDPKTSVDTDLHVDDDGRGPTRLWSNRTDLDLQRLQENRHSKSTSQQTKWATRVFRGTSAIFRLNCSVILGP